MFESVVVMSVNKSSKTAVFMENKQGPKFYKQGNTDI